MLVPVLGLREGLVDDIVEVAGEIKARFSRWLRAVGGEMRTGSARRLRVCSGEERGIVSFRLFPAKLERSGVAAAAKGGTLYAPSDVEQESLVGRLAQRAVSSRPRCGKLRRSRPKREEARKETHVSRGESSSLRLGVDDEEIVVFLRRGQVELSPR